MEESVIPLALGYAILFLNVGGFNHIPVIDSEHLL